MKKQASKTYTHCSFIQLDGCTYWLYAIIRSVSTNFFFLKPLPSKVRTLFAHHQLFGFCSPLLLDSIVHTRALTQ